MVLEGAESANPSLTQETAIKITKGELKDPSHEPHTSAHDDDHFGERKTQKTPAKQEQDKAEYEARKEHSNSGGNTHSGTGMQYVSRKNGSSHDVEQSQKDGRTSKHMDN